ncbi:SbcC/MukB-like Walker B domain-containing protein [Clostridium sp. MB40-C1]|uniref:SbcC/MukB-like Walker B domain-containing protein n=1 Tax=Clostridium sp. MB40-C1 TaxID=3070996 RepID=UPI0027E17B02|nr:AAA family ATPase [Clostridium sp. MB40-C1]WMJ80477.1 SbcC/MukB-like Walker B domain-containing protein [Clostridium sp. MB40-C1]
MKPKILKIEGLNSFEKEQKINFNKLTEKGLFGIFGPTGSGKSTILDAITIALYGKITRTNKGYINTVTKNLSVSYEFEIGVGRERKIYLAERNLKVDKHGAYKTKYARLIEKNYSEDNVIAEGPKEVQKEIEKIIGLTVDDFTRSVVLPQGKFSEFLRLSGKEKRDMLERIFSLEKYGKNLVDKVKKSRNEKIKEQNILTGEFKKYEGLSEDVFREKENELEKLIEEEEILKIKKSNLDKEYEKYKVIYDLEKELKDYKVIEKELRDKSEEYLLKKQSLDKAKKSIIVKPFIDDLNKNKVDIENAEAKLRDLEEKLNYIDEELKITEEKYNIVLEEKEKEIPELIKKESNLLQATEIMKKIQILKTEKNKLLKEHNDVKGRTSILEKELNLLTTNKQGKVKRREEIDNRLKDLRIDFDYKEKLQLCFEKEKEYNKLKNRKEDLDLKVNTKNKEVSQKKEEHKKILEEQKKLDSILLELEAQNNKLKEMNPGDSSLLLEKSQQISFYEKKIEKLLENQKRIQGLDQRLKEIYVDKKTIEENLHIVQNNLKRREEELNVIDKEIEKINKKNLASILAVDLREGKPCPVCGSTHHAIYMEKIDRNVLEEKQEEKTHLEVLLKNTRESLNNFSIKLISMEKEEENLKRDLKGIEEVIGEVNFKNLEEKKESLEESVALFKKKYSEYNKEKEELENQIKIENEKKANINMSEARVSESLKNEKIVLQELKKELFTKMEEFEKITTEYFSLKDELKIEDIVSEIEKIKSMEKESRTIENEEKQLGKDIEKIDKNIEDLKENRAALNIELSKILQSGKEKASIIKSNEEEIERLTEGKNPEEDIKVVKRRINDINELYNILKVKLEKYRNERQEIWNAKLSVSQTVIMLINLQKESIEKLQGALKENNFNNEKEVIEFLLEEEIIKNLEVEINTYEEQLNNVNNNIYRIYKKLNGEHIEEDTWEKIKKERIQNEEILNSKIKEIAGIQKTIEDMKKDLKDLKELRNKEKDISHRLSVLNDIGKLIEGNKFVEFVSMNQLKYIAREASRRLKSITRDRYAIEIDSEGNFTIRDDFNGGEIRDTSTLSGGETFLTSLSLALALSSQVQLKGSAPLEFFFLDEGFGTLDSELLDIVMNSLEKLHSDKLSVGIISHVEELKNRVPIKIIVSPANQGEGGSKVTLEYS